MPDALPEILKKVATGNKQVINLLTAIVVDKHIQTNASFLAIQCLSNIAQGDQIVVKVLLNKLEMARNIEKDILELDNNNEYSRQIEDINSIVGNICDCLSNIANETNKEEVMEKLISILYSTSDKMSRLDIAGCIEKISPNNQIIANEIVNIVECIGYTIRSHIHINIFKDNQKLVDMLFENVLSSEYEHDRIGFAKLLTSITNRTELIEVFSQIILSSKSENEKYQFAELLATIDSDNVIAINQLVIAIQKDKEEDYYNSKFLLHGTKSKATMRRVVLSLSKFINNHLYINEFDNDKQVMPTNITNCYTALQHCAENMSYADFYEAWHSQTASTHPEIADTIPSNYANKIQALERQLLIDCIAIQKELDRNTDHPEIRCLVVDICQLERLFWV